MVPEPTYLTEKREGTVGCLTLHFPPIDKVTVDLGVAGDLQNNIYALDIQPKMHLFH